MAFLGFVRKEFRHILRDRRTLLILFGMPLAQLLLFGFVIRTEVNTVRLAVVDPAKDHVTEEVLRTLEASPYFTIAEVLASSDEIDPVLAAGRADQALVFAPEFARRLAHDGVAQVQIVMDATDPNTARIMLAYTSSVLQDVQQGLLREAGATLPGVHIVPEVRMRFNPTLESVYLFVPGLMAFILMLVSTLMTSITLTREKELGTMEVLLVSPLRPTQIVVGKVVPYLALSFVNVLTILATARFVFGVPVRGSMALLLAESLLFIVAALALGVLISARTRTQQTAMMISLAGLLLPTLLLSGFIFPISSMPVVLQWISHLVPAKWFLLIAKGIMLKGIGLGYLWQETLVLVGMTAAFTALSVRSLNVRLE